MSLALAETQLSVSLALAEAELAEAVEEKQSQILDRLLKKSLNRNGDTVKQVRSAWVTACGGAMEIFATRNTYTTLTLIAARERKGACGVLQEAHG